MERLAIFDVDFTITKRETLIELFLFMLKKNPRFIVFIPRIIMTGLLYGIKIFDEKKSKEAFIKFISGIDEKEMKLTVKDFYEKRLSKILYKDAIDTIKKLKSEGYKIYLISASPEIYLEEFYNIKEVDMVIGTKIKVEKGKYKNSIEGKNNKGEEKVKRLMEVLQKQGIEVDFKNSLMFSDSLADLPLFNLVGNPYLINYKNKHQDIKILNWK